MADSVNVVVMLMVVVVVVAAYSQLGGKLGPNGDNDDDDDPDLWTMKSCSSAYNTVALCQTLTGPLADF